MNHSILVVDDDVEIRHLLCMMLTMVGFRSFSAVDGLDALEKMKREQPDVIILDVMMPNMDGITFCKTLRNNAGTANLPVIMMSARTQQEAIAEAFDAGANRYLIKPTTVDELTRNIQELLAE